jgi:uncharacterized protein (TIGR02996 family)
VSQDHAFLQGVIEQPDDAAPRLVYADWLEENGDPDRAEFIRTQCQLAALPAADPRRPALEARERDLLAGHAREWAEPLRGLVDGWAFSRGFIERVDVEKTREAFFARLPEVWELAPLRGLRLSGAGLFLSRLLAAGDRLRRLTSLQLRDLVDVDQNALRKLIRSPHLAGLTSLVLHESSDRGYPILRGTLQSIGSAPALAGLTELAIDITVTNADTYLDTSVVRALARSPYLRKLTRLWIPFAHFTGQAARELAASEVVARLEVLDLACGATTERGWRDLAESPRLGRLKWLGLESTWVSRSRQDMMREGVDTYLAEDPLAELFLEKFGPEVVDLEGTGQPPSPWWQGHDWTEPA